MARRRYYRKRRYRSRRSKTKYPDPIGELLYLLWRIIWWPMQLLSDAIFMFLWRRWRPQTKGIPSITLKGEYVKSKAEKRISDYLYKNEIKYKYEKPVRVWFGLKKLYPDFYLPEYKVYIEYFGMMSDKKYRQAAYWKMGMYERSKIPVYVLDGSQYNSIEKNLGEIIWELKQKNS